MLNDNTFFMVMELIQGETVIERIQKQTRLSPEDSVRIVGEAALGLSSAHRKGIIHRDISPDNLILVRFENDIGLLETKIVNARKQFNLQKGIQLLDEAEKLLAQQKFETAAQRVEQVQFLRIPDLEPRIRSISGRLSSLQKQNEENLQKAQSLINSARVLIQMGQIGQAQEWLSEARSLGVPELQSEIREALQQKEHQSA